MNFTIELGAEKDIDELEQLYNQSIESLEQGINYPGWKKGVYPIRETASEGINKKTLFVARHNGEIIGTIILNHEPEEAYSDAKWENEFSNQEIFVVHTFVVHPEYLKCGVGRKLLEFAKEYAMEQKIKAIRLDVHEGNMPAIKLYEKIGMKYVDTVDLGLECYGLKWFKIYEFII